MVAALITLALAVAVSIALALDLRDARGEAGGRASALALIALVATVIAAFAPLGALLPPPSLSHVAPVPSWDVIRPCMPPPEPPSHAHAIAPFAVLRFVFPIIVAGAMTASARPVVRPRRVLAVAIPLSLIVLLMSGVRVLRGGAEPASFRACGALTPEDGADASRVRGVIARMLAGGRQELIRWRELPRMPRPPWVRSEIPITIADDPWVLRVRGKGVVAEPDDPRRADRPLPALHFSSIPTLASGEGGATVLVDHRPDGKLYAVRVGRAVQPAEIGPLLRAPRWPALVVLGAIVAATAALWIARPRREHETTSPPYRTAPDEPRSESPLRASLPAFAAFVLVEASATALHVLWPYL